jgi:hypothetical protein
MTNSESSKHARCVVALIFAVGGAGLLSAQVEFSAPTTETNFFAGASRFFANQTQPPRMILNDGLLGGIRETWNFHRHVAIEGSYDYGQNNLRLTPVSGGLVNSVKFASHTGLASATGVFYFQGPESKTRVFLRAGPAMMNVFPTAGAKSNARNPANAYWGATGLNSDLQVGGVYGIGVKWFPTRRFGIRADFEGSAFPQTHFHLASIPGGPGAVYVPPGGVGTLYQVTVGFILGIGHKEMPPPPVAAAPPPPPPPVARLDVENQTVRAIDAGCAGDTKEIPFSVKAATTLAGHQPLYRWTVNGQPAGTNSPNFTYPVSMTPGTYRVAVAVSDDPAASTDTRTGEPVTLQLANVTVQPHPQPTLTVAAAQSELNLGDSTRLTVTPQGNACNRRMTYSCATTEGTLVGTPTTGFNSTGMVFDADRSKMQTKQVNITCTVTDDLGGTGSGSAPVTVKVDPLQVQRFDDIVFAKNNTRVNNCGKRILIEEVYPQLTEHPDWDLVVIGHSSPDEKKGVPLDRQRVMNVIATLTAGSDTCPRLDAGRVRFGLEGTEQKSTTRPAFCGTSTRVKSSERNGQSATAADTNTQFRRVEIYLVPRGAAIPDNATALQVVPADEIRPLACPK